MHGAVGIPFIQEGEDVNPPDPVTRVRPAKKSANYSALSATI